MSIRPATGPFFVSIGLTAAATAAVLLAGCSDPTNDGSTSRSAPAGSSASAPAPALTDPVSIGGQPVTRPAAPAPEAVGSAQLAAANANPRVAAFAGLRAPKPPSWSWQPPTGMRAGTWTIPGTSGGDFATLTAFIGIRGGAESNIQRWVGQFRPEDGGAPLTPDRWTEEVPGVGTAAMMRMSGRFRGMSSVFEAGQTMLGVVIDPSPIGPVQLKFVGPSEVVTAAEEDFLAFVRGLRVAADFVAPAAAPAAPPAAPEGAGANATEEPAARAGVPTLPLAYFATSGAPAARRAHHVALEGRPAPAITVAQPRLAESSDVSPADRATITLDDLRGKIVVVDFWGTWCAPCMKAIPKNVALQEKHAGDGVVFLGVHSTIAPGETMAAAADRLSINYPVAMDVSRASEQAWGVKEWPYYAIIGRDGTVLAAGLRAERVGEALSAVLAAGA